MHAATRTNTMPRTRFVGNINVFTGQNMNKPKSAAKPVDPTAVEICDDPLPSHRAAVTHKYEELFSKLKVGQCLKCETGQAGKIANALRKHLEVRKESFLVRSTERYPADGKGRVWKLANTKPGKA